MEALDNEVRITLKMDVKTTSKGVFTVQLAYDRDRQALVNCHVPYEKGISTAELKSAFQGMRFMEAISQFVLIILTKLQARKCTRHWIYFLELQR